MGELIYEKDADIARPMASISKVMTAMVVLDVGLDMREELTLDPEDFVGPKRASSNLKSGDRLNRVSVADGIDEIRKSSSKEFSA